MVQKLEEINNHKFIVGRNPKTQKRQVAYADQDTVNFEKSFGYVTVWHYAQAVQDKTLDIEDFNENVGIYLRCGCFSYAKMITTEKFKIIQGVTGTLQKINPEIKSILQGQYKIKKEFYCPSMFGKSNLIWTTQVDDGISLELNEDDFVKKIQTTMGQKKFSAKDNLPILIIFEDLEKLEKFEKIAVQNNYIKQGQYQKLLPDTQNKDKTVRDAAKMNSITLMIIEFGRGTDFKVYDHQVLLGKGITIIQTFLSKDINEEIQIKGRVARQGDQGFYNLILDINDPSLMGFMKLDDSNKDKTQDERIKLFQQQLLDRKGKGDIYQYLDQLRNEFYANELKGFQEKLKICHGKHERSQRYLKHLSNNETDQAFQYVIDDNSSQQKLLHFIILIDDSGSMQGSKWDQAVAASKSFISESYNKFSKSFLTLIQFGSNAIIKQEFQVIQKDAGNLFAFRSGGTDFEPPFMMTANLLDQYKHPQVGNSIVLFYTDGSANYPTNSVKKLKQLDQSQVKYQLFIICEGSSTCLSKMTTDLKSCNLQTNVNPSQLNATFQSIGDAIGGGDL